MPAPPKDMTEIVVSFFVISTAACALLLSGWQIHLVHKHYKLSTKPSLNIGTAAKREGSQLIGEEEEGISLRNKGLGPATIKSTSYFFDKGAIRSPAGTTGSDFFALEQIAMALKSWGIVRAIETEAPEVGDYMKENDQMKLLTVKSKNVLKRNEWLSMIDGRLGIAIEYCSVYDECWTSCYNVSKAQHKGCK